MSSSVSASPSPKKASIAAKPKAQPTSKSTATPKPTAKPTATATAKSAGGKAKAKAKASRAPPPKEERLGTTSAFAKRIIQRRQDEYENNPDELTREDLISLIFGKVKPKPETAHIGSKEMRVFAELVEFIIQKIKPVAWKGDDERWNAEFKKICEQEDRHAREVAEREAAERSVAQTETARRKAEREAAERIAQAEHATAEGITLSQFKRIVTIPNTDFECDDEDLRKIAKSLRDDPDSFFMVRTLSRPEMIMILFFQLDEAQSGTVGRDAFVSIAYMRGFNCHQDAWEREFTRLCTKYDFDPIVGATLKEFASILDDRDEGETWYFSDDDLRTTLEKLGIVVDEVPHWRFSFDEFVVKTFNVYGPNARRRLDLRTLLNVTADLGRRWDEGRPVQAGAIRSARRKHRGRVKMEVEPSDMEAREEKHEEKWTREFLSFCEANGMDAKLGLTVSGFRRLLTEAWQCDIAALRHNLAKLVVSGAASRDFVTDQYFGLVDDGDTELPEHQFRSDRNPETRHFTSMVPSTVKTRISAADRIADLMGVDASPRASFRLVEAGADPASTWREMEKRHLASVTETRNSVQQSIEEFNRKYNSSGSQLVARDLLIDSEALSESNTSVETKASKSNKKQDLKKKTRGLLKETLKQNKLKIDDFISKLRATIPDGHGPIDEFREALRVALRIQNEKDKAGMVKNVISILDPSASGQISIDNLHSFLVEKPQVTLQGIDENSDYESDGSCDDVEAANFQLTSIGSLWKDMQDNGTKPPAEKLSKDFLNSCPQFIPLAIRQNHEDLSIHAINFVSPSILNQKDVRGCNLLHIAAEWDMAQLIRKLLGRGAFNGVLEVDKFGWTALHRGARTGSVESCRQLLTHPRFTAVNAVAGRQCYTALHLAAMHGHVDVCDLLVKHPQCNPFVFDIGGRTALHTAVSYNNDQVCKALLTSGRYSFREMSMRDFWSRTALEAAEEDPSNLCGPVLRAAVEKVLGQEVEVMETRKIIEVPKTNPHKKVVESMHPEEVKAKSRDGADGSGESSQSLPRPAG